MQGFVDRSEFARHQDRADTVLQAFGQSARPPMSGESASDYQRYLLRQVQKYSPAAKSVDLYSAPDAALEPLARTIYADAMEVARRPSETQLPDRITLVKKRYGGLDINEFVGKHSFLRDMAPPGRRMVSKIKTLKEFARERALSAAGL